MIAEGRKLVKIADNIAVKVPLTWDGLKACKVLSDEGNMVNVTLCFSANQALLAAKAGATFIVTPGLSAATVTASREAGIPILPGVATATELMAGLDLGVTRFKFFPAEQAGGRAMLDALRGPFGAVRFCPTGGISLDLARDYLKRPNVACVGGGWVCPTKLIDAKKWDEIGALAREAASLQRV